MTLDRLVPHLLLNYPFAPNAGLPNGKVPNVFIQIKNASACSISLKNLNIMMAIVFCIEKV